MNPKIKHYINNCFSFIIFILLRIVFFFSGNSINKKGIIITNLGLLGDAVMSSLFLENAQIFEKYQKVFYVIYEEQKELFNSSKIKEYIIGIDRKRFKYSLFYKYKILKYLRSINAAVSVNAASGRSISNDTISLLACANKSMP